MGHWDKNLCHGSRDMKKFGQLWLSELVCGPICIL